MRLQRIGGVLLAVGALAGASASTASAMAAIYGPACNARLVGAETGTTGSCSFDSPTNYSTVEVVGDGRVTATTRCYLNGYTYTNSRTLYAPGRLTFNPYTPGGACTLTLTSGQTGVTASGTAVPALGPIIADPYPVP